MSPSVKNTLLFAAKAAVAATLITLLVRSGALDFGALEVMITSPTLLALDLFVFALGAVLSALRWRALLGLLDVRVPFARLLQLQLTALFFNVVIPGNVGGDVVKALYVARGEPTGKRASILLIVFVERLVGLAGLVIVASVVGLVQGPALWADPQLRQLAMAVAGLGGMVVVGPLAFILVMRAAGDRLDRLTRGSSALAALVNRLVAAMRLLSSGPKQLLLALTFSMMYHATAIALFTVLARVILARDIGYAAVATVFPLGILTMVLPISPAGIGVGHLAFNRLFSAIGLTGGATVFNVYLIGQITPCLFGVFPYLALRSRGALPTDVEAEARRDAPL